MSNQKQHADVWIKWDWLWTIMFYGSVLFSAVVLVAENDGRLTDIWLPLLLTGVLLLWHWGGLRLAYGQPPSWEQRPSLRFLVLLGDVGLWFVLVNLSSAYYFVLFGMFSQIYRHLPIYYAIITTIILTAAIIQNQLADSGESFSIANPLVWAFLVMSIMGIVLGAWMSAIIHQSRQRRELIEQLEAAQSDLAAAERREGMLEERQRLAHEIHDTLAQGFTSIVLHLEAAEQALPDDPPTVQKHLDRARTTARTSLEQARRVVQDLRPDSLEQHSLQEAIERTAVRWTDETDIPISLATTGDPVPLSPDLEVTLLRATQEALNNIRKHARATHVNLTLSYLGDVVILDIQDNGVGLNGVMSEVGSGSPSPLSGGYGLQVMRERVAQFGGSVELESEPGEGTTLVVSIPITS